MSNIASYFGVNPKKLQRHYKHKSSGYHQWDQGNHADKYLIYPENLTPTISIDEVCLSKGELYTIISNKRVGVQNRKSLIAIISSTESKEIIEVLNKIPLEQRSIVKEVTLDMARNMSLATKTCFPNAIQTIDRFHVVKLAIEVIQHIRVKYRWAAIKEENELIKQSKAKGVKYKPKIYANGETKKELLARSRFLFYKFKEKWTPIQAKRAELLFEMYPELKNAYSIVVGFRYIYHSQNKDVARMQFEELKKKVARSGIEEFNSCINSLNYHMENILNYFENKNTNANAESFNSKIKAFRANLRGVTDVSFFLFRLHKLFA